MSFYRMDKIYCHINQYNASLQCFATLHDFRETHKIENTFTFIRKNKRRSMMRQSLQ